MGVTEKGEDEDMMSPILWWVLLAGVCIATVVWAINGDETEDDPSDQDQRDRGELPYDYFGKDKK